MRCREREDEVKLNQIVEAIYKKVYRKGERDQIKIIIKYIMCVVLSKNSIKLYDHRAKERRTVE